MKKLFLITEAGKKTFLLPNFDAEGFAEAYGENAHSERFGLPKSIDFTNQLTPEEKKAKVPGVTTDFKRILKYYNSTAVTLVSGGRKYSEGMTKLILEKFLPASLELGAAEVCQFLSGIAVDGESKPMSVEILDGNLSKYLEGTDEAKRADVIAGIYGDAIALAENPDNTEAFTRLKEIFQFDIKPAAAEAEPVVPEAEEPEALPVDNAEPVTPESEVEPAGGEISPVYTKTVHSLARTGLLLRHLGEMANILADEAEANALALADSTGVEIPSFKALNKSLPEVVAAEPVAEPAAE